MKTIRAILVIPIAFAVWMIVSMLTFNWDGTRGWQDVCLATVALALLIPSRLVAKWRPALIPVAGIPLAFAVWEGHKGP